MKRLVIPLALAFAIGLALPATATNGYFTHGSGTLNKAMAGAGIALPQESVDLANNPAAAAFLDPGYSASLALFSPDRQYTVIGNPSRYPQTFGLTPGEVSSESKYFPMPSFGANYRSGDNGFGFTLLARGGMNTDYRTNTFYGDDHTGVDLAQMYLDATYARKFARNHALGVTFVGVAQRFKASGLEAFAPMSHDPEHLTGNGYDWSYGAGLQVGYLGRLLPDLSVGATFTPRIKMTKFEKYDGLFANHGSFDIPSSFDLGLAYDLRESVTVAADYQRIHYSDVRAVGHHLFPNLGQAPLGLTESAGFGWNDINVYKIGATWKANADWQFSAGYSKSDQPIPDSEILFNILAPGVIEQHITFGVSRMMKTRPGRFNIAFMFAPSQTVKGANPLEAPGQQQIELKMSEWELEFGYNF
jgi:long-chain fatty acid transport protein